MAVFIGPYEISRGFIAPYKQTADSPQIVHEAEDGSVVVVEKSFSRRFLDVRLKLPVGEAENVANYLENGARFAAERITVVDHNGESWLCRLWGGSVELNLPSNGVIAELKVKFRVEPEQS